MLHRIKAAGFIVVLASLSSGALSTVSSKPALAQHTYSTDFIAQYKERCQSELLSTQKYSAIQASSICQCSLNNFQREKSQEAALSFLMTQEAASLMGDKDARTGLPTELTENYFASCLV